MSLEKRLERRIKADCRKRGGHALKLTTAGERGNPDRLLVFPGRLVWFIELKDEDKEATKLQLSRLRRYQRMGFFTKRINTLVSYLELFQEIDQKLLIG